MVRVKATEAVVGPLATLTVKGYAPGAKPAGTEMFTPRSVLLGYGSCAPENAQVSPAGKPEQLG